ncbi:hypothetical protein [uncultured Helicobacter sp.]|uniref:hypothetical protein n=1 Tax=uncultured Helicobacter sp. TaxID=175537 RepID=UPI0026187FE8|nr:hypothetical protein [uncultured Helicobacter sp.]
MLDRVSLTKCASLVNPAQATAPHRAKPIACESKPQPESTLESMPDRWRMSSLRIS